MGSCGLSWCRSKYTLGTIGGGERGLADVKHKAWGL